MSTEAQTRTSGTEITVLLQTLNNNEILKLTLDSNGKLISEMLSELVMPIY